jgi:glucokinase
VIRFNSKRGYVVGADIGTTGVRTALADLRGTIIEEWELPTCSVSDPESIAILLRSCVRKLVGLANIPQEKILGLAAAVPGITNASAGVVLAAPNLKSGWRDVPFRELLEKRVGIPARIENDMNLSAMGEGWCGLARGVANFVFVTVATGIGAGIVIDRRLYRGSTWAAGEIGYVYVPGTDEAPLAIYRPGSLETIIGAKAIEQSWREARASLDGTDPSLPDDLRVTQVFDLAASGQPQAAAILQRTARILANAITDICVILDVNLVVIGGRVASHPALFEKTRHIMEHNDFCRPRLALSSLGWRAPLLGAIRLALGSAGAKLLPAGTDTRSS